MRPHQKLQSLSMDGCGLSKFDPVLGKNLPQLAVLSLCDNEIADTASLKPIASLKKLQQLYVADNDLTEKPKFLKELMAFNGNIKRIDLELTATGPDSVSFVDRGKQLDLLKEALSSKDGIIDHNEDQATCSCVEGNVCASKNNCFATIRQLVELGLAGPDYKKSKLSLDTRVNISGRQEEVAAAARRAKGIAD